MVIKFMLFRHTNLHRFTQVTFIVYARYAIDFRGSVASAYSTSNSTCSASHLLPPYFSSPSRMMSAREQRDFSSAYLEWL